MSILVVGQLFWFDDEMIPLQVCLKYVVLANMLDLSDINPFAAREAKV